MWTCVKEFKACGWTRQVLMSSSRFPMLHKKLRHNIYSSSTNLNGSKSRWNGEFLIAKRHSVWKLRKNISFSGFEFWRLKKDKQKNSNISNCRIFGAKIQIFRIVESFFRRENSNISNCRIIFLAGKFKYFKL